MCASEELKMMAQNAPGRDGYFAAMYYHVTKSIEDDIKEFANPEAMEEFVNVFSRYYINAYFGSVHSKCWHAAFSSEDDDDLLILQHLMLGINAHVNYDLPQAVNEFTAAEGLDHLTYGDYYYINQKLREAYDKILHNLDSSSRWANEAASLGGANLFHFSLVKARDVAWNSAERLRSTNEPDEFLAYLDELVSVLAYLITKPPRILRPVVFTLGLMEEGDPRKVTNSLLRED